VAGGEPAGSLSNGEGSRADAIENGSGVVDRVRPLLPMRGSCRRQHDAARGPAPPGACLLHPGSKGSNRRTVDALAYWRSTAFSCRQ
jgi:hypothetical protein